MSLHYVYNVFALILAANAAVIPDYIHICKRSDPRVSKCILESVEFLKPKLLKGIPELDVPALEPLRIANIVLGRSGSASFKIQLNDIDVYGLGDYKVEKLKVDVPNYTYKVQVSFPKIRLVGHYDVDVKILSLPIKGDGNFDANATKCTGVGILKSEIINENGIKKMHFTNVDLNLNIGDYHLNLADLFKNDQDLNNSINEVLNQNKAEFIRIATPYVTDKTKEIILNIANKIVKHFSYDDVFPEK